MRLGFQKLKERMLAMLEFFGSGLKQDASDVLGQWDSEIVLQFAVV